MAGNSSQLDLDLESHFKYHAPSIYSEESCFYLKKKIKCWGSVKFHNVLVSPVSLLWRSDSLLKASSLRHVRMHLHLLNQPAYRSTNQGPLSEHELRKEERTYEGLSRWAEIYPSHCFLQLPYSFIPIQEINFCLSK